MNKGKTEKSGKYFQFYKHIQKRDADAAKGCIKRLTDAADAGNCQVYMRILERRFPTEFGRQVYRSTNSVSENKNENIELVVNNADEIRQRF